MLDQTLNKIEERLKQAGALESGRKAELLQLLEDLKGEIAHLAHSNPDHAQSIASFADVSTHEATRDQPQPVLLRHAVDGLSSSVIGFEQAHPKLTDAVNRLAVNLSNMGV